MFILRNNTSNDIAVEFFEDPRLELTIGVGGITKQKIHKDPFDALSHWDWYNSQFLRIGPLNGTMFHKVTTLLPPSSLLAAESLDPKNAKMLPGDLH
jgi:hypothetical protein